MIDHHRDLMNKEIKNRILAREGKLKIQEYEVKLYSNTVTRVYVEASSEEEAIELATTMIEEDHEDVYSNSEDDFWECELVD